MRLFILSLVAILTATTTHAAVSNQDRAIVERGRNLLDNGGFESGRAKWTASGGTFTTTTTAANLGVGGVSGSWDSSAASQTLTSTAVAIPAGLYGRNGVASCIIQGASATHTIQAYDGTNILGTTTITSSATYARTSINFIFPSSGSVSLRLVSVAADEPTIYVDDCYLGPADGYNISQISQAELFGSLRYAGAASCSWNSTSTSWANFAADTDCATATLIGNASAPGTKIPAITFASLPPGRYMVVASGQFQSDFTTTATQFTWAISDGTNRSGNTLSYAPTSADVAVTPGNVSGVFEYTTAQSNVTFNLQTIRQSGSGTAYIINTVSADTEFKITVYRFPTTQETAYRADLINWKVDANISGANPSLGTAAVSSYTGIENGSLTLTNNSGSGNIAAQIPCSSTNAPTGTTCSVGNESVGVSFTVPTAGDVMACASFGVSNTDGATDPQTAFQIVETASNAQTILQEGKTKINNLSSSSSLIVPYRLCGNFTFSAAGQKTLRLMYEQTAATTATTLAGDADANVGQRDIHWEVYPINQAMPVPVLVGSVTNSSSGQTRTEAANINCDGASAITSQLGSWVSSVGNISAGACSMTLITGAFSAAPYCVATDNGGFSTTGKMFSVTASSATALSVDCEDDASTACASSDFTILCTGAK